MDVQPDQTRPFSKSDVEEAVGKDSSFAFECQAFKRLKKWFSEMQHCGTYIDPVTNMHREFDIRASATATSGAQLRLAIECKQISDATPVVVLRTRRKLNEKGACRIAPIAPHNEHSGRMARIQDVFLRYSEGSVGRSIEQYHRAKGGELKKVRSADSVYPKWSQAVASCHELVVGSLRAKGKHSTFVVPVLLIPNKCLWVIDFDEDGNPSDAKEVAHCEIFIDAPIGEQGFRATHLEIWTIGSIDERVQSFEDSF